MKLIHLIESNNEQACDDLLQHLTSVWRSMDKLDNGISPEGKQTIRAMYNSLRADLLKCDVEEFGKTWEHYASTRPDAFDFFADELLVAVTGKDDATYEDMMKAVGL